MNADKLPDVPEDPVPAAETSHLPDSPPPENPARPEPEPSRPCPPDQPPDPEPEARELDREPSPASPSVPGSTPDSAEPRSRQEHADPPSTEDLEIPAEDELGDEETRAKAEADTASGDQGGERSSSDVTTQEEIDEEPAEDHRVDDSSPNKLPSQESITSDGSEAPAGTGRHDEDSSDQEDLLSKEASDPNSVPRGEKSPEPADDIPTHDRTQPLTDKEWLEHVTEVRDSLDKARAAGLTTDRLYTIDPDHKEWAAERNRLQGSIVADLYERAREVPSDHEAIIAGGLGGAGKTTVLTGHAGIDLSRYLTINPDDIKEEMARRGMIPEIDGLSPMEASDLAHEESSYIAKRLAVRATADGKNIIWDITMSSQESTHERINNLRDAAYAQVDGIFIDIPPDISITRTELRHREGHEQWRAGQGLGGRFVPPEVIQRQLDSEWGSQNRRTYEAMKEKFTSWSIYDNSVYKRSPVLIDSSEQGKSRRIHTERPT